MSKSYWLNLMPLAFKGCGTGGRAVPLFFMKPVKQKEAVNYVEKVLIERGLMSSLASSQTGSFLIMKADS
jgi:hypothetical protein